MGAYVKRYKTLLIIQGQFFCPGMRKGILKWVRGCDVCIPANARIRASNEVVQSWPISSPVENILVDLWTPGAIINHLMNSIYYIMQFISAIANEYITASHLAQLFMEDALLKFGLCTVIIVDASRDYFTVGIEQYHEFLNHTTTIYAKEWVTPEYFVESSW